MRKIEITKIQKFINDVPRDAEYSLSAEHGATGHLQSFSSFSEEELKEIGRIITQMFAKEE